MSSDAVEDLVETMFDESGVAYDFDWRDFTLPYGPEVKLTLPQTRALVRVVMKYVHGGYNMGGYIVNPWTVLEAINHFNFRNLKAPDTILLTVNGEQVPATQEFAMGLYWAIQALGKDTLITLPDGRKLILQPPIAYRGIRHRLNLKDHVYAYATEEFVAGIRLAHQIHGMEWSEK